MDTVQEAARNECLAGSYATPKFVGPQNRHNGKYPHSIIKEFRALLDNMQDATQRVSINCGTLVCIMHKSRNKMYILDEQLHVMKLCI
jgi:hypothetical protein